jgi:signal transduction histidine kinase
MFREQLPHASNVMRFLVLNARRPPLRLLWAGAGFLIAVLVATSTTVVLRLHESVLLDRESDLANISLTLAEEADRSFQSVDLVISSIAAEVGTEGVTDAASFEQKMSGYDVYRTLRETITGIPQLSAVVVINSNGRVINFSRSWPTPEIDNSGRDYFRAMKADPNLQSYISEPLQNHGSGTWSIFLVRRVNGPSGEFIGLILGTIDLRYFEDFYQAISLGEDSSIALQRSDGVMLARFPSTAAIGKTFSRSERLLGDRTSAVLREASPIDGTMRIKAARLLTNYPVVVLATETEKAVLAGWWSITWLISLGALGCILSIALAAFALGRQWKQHATLAAAQAEIRHQEDLTEALDAMRVAKEAAESADRAKSEFLANMSHELRTPLNAVLGFSEIMINEAYGPLGDERYHGYVHDIHTSGSHLLRIINDILDLSKASSGKLELIRDWFDAREVVNSVSRLIQPRVDDQKLSLRVNLPPDDLSVFADERILTQMLFNLLSNACKFTPPNGRIECSVAIDASAISFIISDTGIGIPPEHLEGVLQPFVQIESSLSRQHEGTGLGLALVKTMAELHGGLLRLDSEVDRGTTATVILPLSRLRPANTDAPPGSATSSLSPERAAASQ